MHKRSTGWLFVLWVGLCTSYGAQAQSLFWEVKSPTATVYLLGSLHMATAEIFPLPAVIEQAFERAEVLVLEAKLDGVSGYEMGKAMRDKGLYHGAETIYDHIDADTKRLFQNYIKERGQSEAALIKFRPAVLWMTMAGLEAQRLGLKQEYGIDLYFSEKARLSRKDIIELEGMQYQLNLLLNMPDTGLIKYLMSSMEDMAEELHDMIRLWKSGDTAAFHTLFYEKNLDKFPEMRSIMRMLVDDRNKGMVEKIKGYLQSNRTYFVVVGAGHMTGEKGIVQLLRQAAFKVVQM